LIFYFSVNPFRPATAGRNGKQRRQKISKQNEALKFRNSSFGFRVYCPYVDARESAFFEIQVAAIDLNRHGGSVNRHYQRDATAKRRHQKFAPKLSEQISGDPSAVAPPVPIPNTEVKRCSPDGSTAIGRARVGRRQN
jgi:hypothetical protein